MNIDVQKYTEFIVQWAITSGLAVLVIIFLMLVALKVSRILSDRGRKVFKKRIEGDDIEFEKRADTLGAIVNKALSMLIIMIASMMILSEMGIEIGPILATAGVLGLAVGFGAQKLVEDIISGFFMLLEDQIRTGDVVQIADKGGLVEKVNLRTVVLRDLAGNVHYVRNGLIGVVTNMTKEYSRYVFEIGVSYREDTDEVVKIIQEVDEQLRKDDPYKDDILEPIEILGLDEFADSAVIIKARTKTKPIKQWSVAREFNRRLKKRFDEENIEIPFPHLTLYAGEDKKGNSPVFNLAVDEKDRTHKANKEN